MTTLSGPDAVLSRVTSRLRWAGFGRRLSTLILSISTAVGVAVLFVRLTGLVSLPLDEMVTSTAGLIGIQTIGVADWAGLGVLAVILLLPKNLARRGRCRWLVLICAARDGVACY